LVLGIRDDTGGQPVRPYQLTSPNSEPKEVLRERSISVIRRRCIAASLDLVFLDLASLNFASSNLAARGSARLERADSDRADFDIHLVDLANQVSQEGAKLARASRLVRARRVSLTTDFGLRRVADATPSLTMALSVRPNPRDSLLQGF
jgi:hypothetical protein